MYGSKSLTDTQANYTTVEIKALTILYPCQNLISTSEVYRTLRSRNTTDPYRASSNVKCTAWTMPDFSTSEKKLAKYNYRVS